MATIALTQENVESLIQESGTIIIDFWAEWCGPCRAFGPTFEAASEKHSGVVFAKCDTEAEQEVAAMFQVRSIPMIVVFRDGVALFQQSGALPPAALDELLQKVSEIDMDEVRKQVEVAQAADE